MADNLTKNIQAILKERGTAASLTQVQDALDKLSSPLITDSLISSSFVKLFTNSKTV